jgi:hypothetical protein
MSDIQLPVQEVSTEVSIPKHDVHPRSRESPNVLSLIFIVPTHWNNSPWVHMSFYWDTLSWFQANSLMLWAYQKSSKYHFFDLTWPGSWTHDLSPIRISALIWIMMKNYMVINKVSNLFPMYDRWFSWSWMDIMFWNGNLCWNLLYW